MDSWFYLFSILVFSSLLISNQGYTVKCFKTNNAKFFFGIRSNWAFLKPAFEWNFLIEILSLNKNFQIIPGTQFSWKIYCKWKISNIQAISFNTQNVLSICYHTVPIMSLKTPCCLHISLVFIAFRHVQGNSAFVFINSVKCDMSKLTRLDPPRIDFHRLISFLYATNPKASCANH